MKKLRFIFSAFAVSIVMLSGGIRSDAMEHYGTLTYIQTENEAIITGCTGSPETLEVPEQIDGLPVTEIRENAFYKCTSLKRAFIPESVSKIGRYAFFGCTALESAEINGSAQLIPEGLFYGCSNLDKVTLNSSPTVIGDYAFFGCDSITSFEIPLSVTDIGTYCFADCKSLSRVDFGYKLQNIGQYAFYNCQALENIVLPENILSIGQFAIGFLENGMPSNITITGAEDSIAGHYAGSNGIRFKNRIRYTNGSSINIVSASGFLTWMSFATVYFLLMYVTLSRRKFK